MTLQKVSVPQFGLLLFSWVLGNIPLSGTEVLKGVWSFAEHVSPPCSYFPKFFDMVPPILELPACSVKILSRWAWLCMYGAMVMFSLGGRGLEGPGGHGVRAVSSPCLSAELPE